MIVSSHNMINAELIAGELVFASEKDFEEALHTGFFRIPVPKGLDLKVGQTFAETFPKDARYNQFEKINFTEGFLRSQTFQLIRFQFEKKHWKHFPPELQEIGHRLHLISIQILRSILKTSQIPEQLWVEATSGAAEANANGSSYLSFSHYSPTDGVEKQYGVTPHQDWDYITLVHPHQEGLQFKIGHEWKTIPADPNYLVVNFGLALSKLLPKVHAAIHRVITQTRTLRTSIVSFVVPREKVYSWDLEKKELTQTETVDAFFKRLEAEWQGYKDK